MTPEQIRAEITDLLNALPDDADVLNEVLMMLQEFETFITTGEVPVE